MYYLITFKFGNIGGSPLGAMGGGMSAPGVLERPVVDKMGALVEYYEVRKACCRCDMR